jgi:glucan phosphoethanolaminetransferase (alkaline phosphatase superfamily)
MFRTQIITAVDRLLRHAAASPHARYVPALSAALTFTFTFTMLAPATFVIMSAVLLAPGRWKAIVLQSSLTSAIAATILFGMFEQLGWDQLQALFPEMQTSAAWMRIVDWVQEWGILALFVVAAMPVPQSPALVFISVGGHGGSEVMLAIFAGKLIKYGVVAWATATFPAKVRAWIAARRSPGHRSRAP